MNIKEIRKKSAKDNENYKKSNYIYIIKGIIISILITMICLIIFSVILTNSNIQEKTIFPVVTIITVISITIGSIISSIKIKNKGIINGGLVGGIYIIFIYILSSIFFGNFLLNLYSIIMIILAILFGMVGGVLGVNCSSSK